MDDQLADVAEAILGIARELRLRIDADPDRLTASEAHVMRYINHRPGVTPSEVARFTGLQRSNLSTALRALGTKGLVERRADTTDARTVKLFPTRRATNDLARLRRQWATQVSTALGADTRRVGHAAEVLSRLESGLIADRLGYDDPVGDDPVGTALRGRPAD
ncbi:MAG: MarR family transcriptional regulator [Mycobacterium sp.]|nr:MarR family transcriptional regulator [Mycobacterium sp.]